MSLNQPSSAEACADLVSRGIPENVAADLVMRLAGASNNMLRLGMVSKVLSSLAGPSDDPSSVASEAARWLRKHNYLSEPVRCRWCGQEASVNDRVFVRIDGVTCDKCSKSRGST